MGKTLNILVAGGFDVSDPTALNVDGHRLQAFAKHLGAEIVRQGHTLLTGCQTELDRTVAESAQEATLAESSDRACPPRIISYVLKGRPPVHSVGIVIQSQLPDWDLNGLQPTPPEVVKNADVNDMPVIFWECFEDFKLDLEKRVRHICTFQGRRAEA